MGLALGGTRPGHPYADVVFAFAFQKVLQLLVAQLDHSDLRPRVPAAHPEDPLETQGTHLMPLPAFFDDFVIPVTATSPAELFDNMSSVISITGQSFARRGMIVNDKPGKTEAMLAFHGSHKHDMNMARTRAHIKVEHRLFGVLKVNIVHHYRHLGSVSHPSGCHKPSDCHKPS